MLPRTIACADCGETAAVRAYSHVRFVTLAQRLAGPETPIASVQLTVDCPRCGMKAQPYSTHDPSCELSMPNRTGARDE